MSFTWGAVVGACSPIPYFYSVFFITVLIHRCGRDFERCVPSLCASPSPLYILIVASCVACRCSIKYGKDWERYCAIVKYKFIPYVY